MRWMTMAIILLAAVSTQLRAEELIKNGSFEKRDAKDKAFPADWTVKHHQYQPFEFSSEHYSGKLSAMAVGDGQARMWRQNILAPKDRSWMLSAMVKTENLVLGKLDYVSLYCHVIYKDQPYSSTTHISVPIKAGTNDWTLYKIPGATQYDHEIELLHISILGKFSQGRVYFDNVSLTADMSLSDEALLANKIEDLETQLARIGNIDPSITKCRSWLDKAKANLAKSPPDVGSATSNWHSAAKMLTHKVWAAMYPKTIANKKVEARMLYHGMGQDKAGSDAYIHKLKLTGCNAVYLSFGSWMYVNYHSDILPTEPGWEKFDALTYFIDAAHQQGLKVFGYLAPFYGTNDVTVYPRSIAKDHPEWLAKAPQSNVPKFPDPANPDVVDYIVSAYEELATRYKLDGIGLDYIRYPTPNSLNYDEHNRKLIKAQYGIDILEHENLFGDPEAWPKIQEYRHKTIGKVVKRVRDAIKAARPDITVMACLISELDMARDEYGQNWAVSSKWIDYASPMNYDDRSLDKAMLARQKAVCAKNKTIFIPAIGGMPEVHRSWTISEWANRVALQRELDPDGMIIYRIAEFDTAVAAFFGKGPFYGDAKFPGPLK